MQSVARLAEDSEVPGSILGSAGTLLWNRSFITLPLIQERQYGRKCEHLVPGNGL